MEMPKFQTGDWSLGSIIKFFAVLLSLVFIYYVRDIILILFVAFIISAILRPGVDFLTARKVPRTLSILFFFVLVIAIIAIVMTIILPVVFQQAVEFMKDIPSYYASFNKTIGPWLTSIDKLPFSEEIQEAAKTVNTSSPSIVERLTSFFGGIVSFVLMLVIAFYLLLEEESIKRFAKSMMPEESREFWIDLIKKIQLNINAWFKGQLTLSLIMGILVYVSLTVLGVKYALAVAVLIFVGEFIPYLGPFIAAFMAVVLALGDSALKGLFTALLFVFVQQAESHVLIPGVMKKAVGLNPVITIVSLLVGYRLAGVAGMVLAIPVITSLIVFVQEYWQFRKREIKQN